MSEYFGKCIEAPINQILIVNSKDEDNKFTKINDTILNIQFERFAYHINFENPTLDWYLNVDNTGPIPLIGDIHYIYSTESKILYKDNQYTLIESKGLSSAKGLYSHAEGWDVAANGQASSAEGRLTQSNGNFSHVEGEECVANGQGAHAEGYSSYAEGGYSHSENAANAVGIMSHAEGVATCAKGDYSHAEGIATQANHWHTHAEGASTEANQPSSHAEGWYSIADGICSHAEGHSTNSGGPCSHAAGDGTSAANYAATAIGKFNKPMKTGGEFNNNLGDAFVIGNGYSEDELQNAFRVTYTGDVFGRKFLSSGENYALYIAEWGDRNLYNEDRIGYFVTITDGKLYIADIEDEDYLVGVTTANSSFVSNADEDYFWKYERDEFGRIILDNTIGQNTIDDGSDFIHTQTGNMIPYSKESITNIYDSTLQESYKTRELRPEWDLVGIIGIVRVRDDGTCVSGQYCKLKQNGIVTNAGSGYATQNKFLVINRISENVVSILLK